MPEPKPDPLNKLSKREIGLVALLAEGLSNKQISAQLKISQSTVRTHLLHIYQKLNIHCRTEAAAIYFRSTSASRRHP